MDAQLRPPTRIVPEQVIAISKEEAQERIAAFLEDHAKRTRLSGGDSVVSGQLAKLHASLQGETEGT